MNNVLQLTKSLAERPEAGAGTDFCIRAFRGPKDITPWLQLRRAAFARERLVVREWNEADFAAEFLDRWWWRPERMWLAEAKPAEPRLQSADASPHLIGTVTLAFRGAENDARPVVHWLFVHPRWRRRGVGRALMAHLERAAWDLGHQQVLLETHAGWQGAAAMYQALGYEPA